MTTSKTIIIGGPEVYNSGEVGRTLYVSRLLHHDSAVFDISSQDKSICTNINGAQARQIVTALTNAFPEANERDKRRADIAETNLSLTVDAEHEMRRQRDELVTYLHDLGKMLDETGRRGSGSGIDRRVQTILSGGSARGGISPRG